MFQKCLYGILAVFVLLALFMIDLTMVIPFASNQIIVSVMVFAFYLYLSYLIIFRKIF